VLDVLVGVQRTGREAQPLGPLGHGGIVDRLHVDAESLHQDVEIIRHFTGSLTITGMMWLGFGMRDALASSRAHLGDRARCSSRSDRFP
jgi:hypothetical protein